MEFLVENKFHIEVWMSPLLLMICLNEWNHVYFYLTKVSERINDIVEWRIQEKRRQKNPEQEVLWNKADWRHNTGVGTSILSLVARVGGKMS
jgi:hypothetical protein